MNTDLLKQLLIKSLAKQITFPEILNIIQNENIDSYHVDFIRNEVRFYDKNNATLISAIDFQHNGVSAEFNPEELASINQRVQSGQADYAGFVREATAIGCAYYIVYPFGRKVRYFGRNGDEYLQNFPTPQN